MGRMRIVARDEWAKVLGATPHEQVRLEAFTYFSVCQVVDEDNFLIAQATYREGMPPRYEVANLPLHEVR